MPKKRKKERKGFFVKVSEMILDIWIWARNEL